MCQRLLSEVANVLAARFTACAALEQDAPRDFHHFWEPQPRWQDDLASPGALSGS